VTTAVNKLDSVPATYTCLGVPDAAQAVLLSANPPPKLDPIVNIVNSGVEVGVAVGVFVAVPVLVGVAVGVLVGVFENELVGVAVAVGHAWVEPIVPLLSLTT